MSDILSSLLFIAGFALFILIIYIILVLIYKYRIYKLKRKYCMVVDYCKVFGYTFVSERYSLNALLPFIFSQSEKEEKSLLFAKEVSIFEIKMLAKEFGYDMFIPESSKIFECISICDDLNQNITLSPSGVYYYGEPYICSKLSYFYFLEVSKGKIVYSTNYRKYIDNRNISKIFNNSKQINGESIKNTIDYNKKEAIYYLIEEINNDYYYEEPYNGFKIGDIDNIRDNEIWYTSTDGNAAENGYIAKIKNENIVSNTYINGKGILTFKSKITTIEKTLFEHIYGKIECFVIPNSVTSIANGAFNSFDYLAEVVIPSSVKSIGNNAFSVLKRLSVINIPGSVKNLGDYAFYGCINLKDVTISSGVNIIGKKAFLNCHSLLKVSIPNTIEEIGDGAFKDCSSLSEIYCEAKKPPKLGYNVFNDNALDRKIYIPRDLVAEYKQAQGWRLYAKHIIGY